jgi:DNA-directed RNA polymerase specialized sigma subunit
MEAKEFLRRFKKLDRLIENKTIELLQCKESCLNITSKLGGERVQGTGNPHRMADAIAKYVDLEREIKEHIDNAMSAKKEITDIIEILNADQYDVLHKLYIQKMTFKEIAYECGKSESWATTVHGRALKVVQKILDEREMKEA